MIFPFTKEATPTQTPILVYYLWSIHHSGLLALGLGDQIAFHARMLFPIEQKHHVLYLLIFLIVWSVESLILKYQIGICWIYILVV